MLLSVELSQCNQIIVVSFDWSHVCLSQYCDSGDFTRMVDTFKIEELVGSASYSQETGNHSGVNMLMITLINMARPAQAYIIRSQL